MAHERCFACGSDNPIGLKLNFSVDGNCIKAFFFPRQEHQGFSGIVHGGLITTLLDAAMVKLLLFKGISALTTEIRVRFREPVPVDKELLVTGEIQERKMWVIRTRATLSSLDGSLLAEADAKFVENKYWKERTFKK